jgi:hypothetical protein
MLKTVTERHDRNLVPALYQLGSHSWHIGCRPADIRRKDPRNDQHVHRLKGVQVVQIVQTVQIFWVNPIHWTVGQLKLECRNGNFWSNPLLTTLGPFFCSNCFFGRIAEEELLPYILYDAPTATVRAAALAPSLHTPSGGRQSLGGDR